MLYYIPARRKVLDTVELQFYGYTENSSGVHLLTYMEPRYDKRTQYVSDTVIVDGPDESGAYKIVSKIDNLPFEIALLNMKQFLKEQVTDKRWQVETGGIALPDGTRIATTIDDQNRISSALQGMSDAGIAEVDFKASSGWVKLTKEQLTAIAGLIANHVQACFSRERLLHEAIDTAKTLEELYAIEIHSGWPGQTPPREEQPVVNDKEPVANNS